MYHISKDKRTIESARLIYEGLLECLKTKAFDQITVSDLQKESGVARSTFYRAFDNISDVLYWKCDTRFQEALNGFQPDFKTGEKALAFHYFRYWMEHGDILEVLMKINRQDIIYACHMKNAEALQKRLGALPGMNEQRGLYFMSIRTGFTISILMAWLKGGRRESAKELMDIIEEQLDILAGNFHLTFKPDAKKPESTREE